MKSANRGSASCSSDCIKGIKSTTINHPILSLKAAYCMVAPFNSIIAHHIYRENSSSNLLCNIFDAHVVGVSLTAKLSLTAIGTPAKRTILCPMWHALGTRVNN